MMRCARWAACLALLPLGAAAQQNYLGILKPPRTAPVETPNGIYSFTTPLFGLTPRLDSGSGYRFKLGYKYSRYLAVEGELVDTGPASSSNPFAGPATLSPSFRSTGFGVDTVATLPLWRFSFYGRLGAYRGDARGGFGGYATSLLPDHFSRGARWRYGLGLRYDFTRSLGVRAEVERHSPFGSSLGTEADAADQLSVGVSWRF